MLLPKVQLSLPLLPSNTNNLCNEILFLLFPDNIKIFCHVTFVVDFLFLQPDINSLQKRCTANNMKLNAGKTKAISFSRKAKVLAFNRLLYNFSILPRDCCENHVSFLGCNLYFHHHLDHLRFHTL